MPRLLRAASVAAVCALLLSGCFDADRRLVEGAIEEWEAPSFYESPDPAVPGDPGEIVRSETIASTMAGSVAWRVLYHSRDVHGDDVLVSGVVVAPAKEAPAGGRPVVSWAHPTTGSAPRCAPSVGADPFDLIEGLRALLDAGYVVAATDYPGMGADGPNSYLVGQSEGNSVLDAARAARAIAETGANDHLLLWGHSQGGQAALFAAQDAASYAPELQLDAVAVAAPATDLGALLDAVMSDVSGVTISSYALQAYSTVYADRGATLSGLLTPAGVTATPKMASLCLIGQNSAIHDIARPLVGNYFIGDPSKVEPWATLLAENSPGAVALTVPLFVAQGDTDTLVDPATTRAFADHECAIGTGVTYLPIPDTGHGLVALRAVDRVIAWFDDVRSGRPIDSHC